MPVVLWWVVHVFFVNVKLAPAQTMSIKIVVSFNTGGFASRSCREREMGGGVPVTINLVQSMGLVFVYRGGKVRTTFRKNIDNWNKIKKCERIV